MFRREKLIRPKGIFLVQLPPPYHGVSIFNDMLINSKVIKESIEMYVIPANTANCFIEIQKFGFGKIVKVIKTVFILLRVLLFRHYDFFYVTFCPTGYAFYRDLIYIALGKIFRIKIIIHLHGKGMNLNKQVTINRFLSSWCFKDVIVIILANNLYDDIADFVKRESCVIFSNAIPYCINDEKLQIVRNMRLAKKDEFNILFFSNILISKGALVLLEAARILKDKNYKFKIQYAGQWFDDGCKNKMEKEIRKHGLKDLINFAGYCTGADKYEQFATADIFIHPTLNDTYALVILEAMEFGLPIISTYEGTIPEILDNGLCGLLVAKNDSVVLSSAMEQLIKDGGLRKKLGENARRRFLENYTFDNYEIKMSKFLCDISRK